MKVVFPVPFSPSITRISDVPKPPSLIESENSPSAFFIAGYLRSEMRSHDLLVSRQQA